MGHPVLLYCFALPKQKDGEHGYEFGYQVENAETATSYGHVESGDGDNVVRNERKVQSGASYLSQGFVMFFYASREGLPGQ